VNIGHQVQFLQTMTGFEIAHMRLGTGYRWRRPIKNRKMSDELFVELQREGIVAETGMCLTYLMMYAEIETNLFGGLTGCSYQVINKAAQ
jgi:hypothetical protein